VCGVLPELDKARNKTTTKKTNKNKQKQKQGRHIEVGVFGVTAELPVASR
jgi:hypothetical protein